MPWRQGLEGPALTIAETDELPICVQAGPGTGKTFALMRRVARLMSEGADPRRVLVATFTRTAATDLLQKLQELGINGAEQIDAKTLHSFCFSVLAREEVFALTGRFPRPLLKYEETFLIADLATQFGGRRAVAKQLRAFSAAWARLQTDEAGWPHDETDAAFQNQLVSWLRFHNAMLIGELVPETLRYLRNNPMARELTDYDFVLVDEYQDLNKAEQELLDRIGSAGRMIVIGDHNQSIYSFKHAHPEGILNFESTRPGTTSVSLIECRRCGTQIVGLANALIAHNSGPRRILLPREGNPQGEVHIVQWPTLEDEMQGVANYIAASIQQGKAAAGQILILAPRRQIGYGIRDALNALGIPAHSFFHEEALEGDPGSMGAHDAQEAFTLLTLLAHPDDRIALRAWLGFDSQQLRSPAWQRIRSYCESNGSEPFDLLADLARGNALIANIKSLLPRYAYLIRRLDELADIKGRDLLSALFPEDTVWAEPLRTAIGEELDDDAEAKDILERLKTFITQPELPTDVDYVRIMSLHKSKGLTADLVVVAGCIEGLLPMLPDGLTGQELDRVIEEQRRLFYVALTRSTQTLIISSATTLPRALAYKMRARISGPRRGVNTRSIASRFIDELGPSRPVPIAGEALRV